MTVADNLALLNTTLKSDLLSLGRQDCPVHLVAVSKQQSLEKLKQAYAAGQRDFGENYVQEALQKIPALPKESCWHFIGSIQKNKTRLIAENFSWVHTLARENIAERLHLERPVNAGQLNVCVQVNIDEEPSKSGIMLNEIQSFLARIGRYQNLKLRGLMFLPQQRAEYREQLQTYQRAQKIFLNLRSQYPSMDTLSMGTSKDYRAAIIAGSNMIRIGAALFGERSKK